MVPMMDAAGCTEWCSVRQAESETLPWQFMVDLHVGSVSGGAPRVLGCILPLSRRMMRWCVRVFRVPTHLFVVSPSAGAARSRG